MLEISLDSLRAIERGAKLLFRVKVYWQAPEIYIEEDLLENSGDLFTSMSEGGYSIANTTVALKNEGYYFSRKLARELPNNRLVEIFFNVGFEDILAFRGIIPTEKGWTLTDSILTLNINA